MATNPESKVEKYLAVGVRERGGECFKFTSPGRAGVPDRIVVWPNGTLHFVEVKTITGRLDPLQVRCLARLEQLHQKTSVLYGTGDVEQYLEAYGKC